MRKDLPGVKKFFGGMVLFCIASNLLLLVFYPPKMLENPCPVVISGNKSQLSRNAHKFTPKPIDCTFIYSKKHTSSAPSLKWCRRHDAISDFSYLEMASNCSNFIKQRQFNRHPIKKEEKDFPLAFSILMHSNVEQVERMLRAIYRPHNVYCIHVDAKSASSIHMAMQAITKCLPNVFMASRTIPVHWAEFSVLEAELICLNDLWQHKQWKYYINLAGTEFPLKTNLELVQILKAYKGGNEIDGSPSQ